MGPTEESSSSTLRKSLGHRLTRTKQKGDTTGTTASPSISSNNNTRRVSMDVPLPDRLKDQGDDEDKEDVTAATTNRYLNQSIFSLVAAAGSTVDFQSRFDENSDSGSDGEDDGRQGERRRSSDLSKTVPALRPQRETGMGDPGSGSGSGGAGKAKHKRESSTSRLLKGMHKLRLKPIRERKSSVSADDHMSTSQILQPPRSRPRTTHHQQEHHHEEKEEEEHEPEDSATSNDVPMLSRIIQAEAEMVASTMLADPSTAQDLQDMAKSTSQKSSVGSGTLAKRLMDIFGFDEPENVISEWPCWLLQSVLVQGFLYVTQKHICFYAYLPKKATNVAKSGYLSKRGRRDPRYTRKYVQLKGDVLSYYEDPSQIYYPSGQIDLRLTLSANLTNPRDKENCHFILTTDKREYMFKADSPSSARDWVKMLQKVIFRSRNDGDSVKISLPIENIMDVEGDRVLDFADTIKIRVIDNDETYAIDEYFFSFFTLGQEAARVLRIMIEDNNFHRDREEDVQTDSDAPESNDGRRSSHVERTERTLNVSVRTPALRETVRATLSPNLPVPRSLSNSRLSVDSRRSSLDVRPNLDIRRRSYDTSKRPSSDLGRRSVSNSRSRHEEKSPVGPRGAHSSMSPHRQESFGSPTDSEGPHTSSSAAVQSMDDTTNASASQILNRSDVFQVPTIHSSHRIHSDDVTGGPSRDSQDTARSSRHRQLSPRPSEVHKPRAGSVSPAMSADPAQLQGASSSYQALVHAGSYPARSAAGIAGFLRTRSKRMSNLLATDAMGYYEKVSGMWAGNSKHYDTQHDGMAPDDDFPDENDGDKLRAAENFRGHFALPQSEQLVASFFGSMQRVVPLYGKIYIGSKHFCYRSMVPGYKLKLILPLKDIESVDKGKSYRYGYHGVVLVIRGHEEIFFDFSDVGHRDDCTVTLLNTKEKLKKHLKDSTLLTEEEELSAETAKAEHHALQEARADGHAEHDVSLPSHVNHIVPDAPPVLFDDPRASIMNFKPTESLNITCLTIGSRGDVQPYIALCKGLIKEGHKATIATHDEFGPWVESHGIRFKPVAGDPAELMRICVENGMFSYSFMKVATAKFRGWLDDLLESAWEACQGSDLLIESPSAMCGIHIAEALQIPYFRAFGMPWTRTRAYPHAFVVPEKKMGGNYNTLSYVLIENLFWKTSSAQINRWRKRSLKLGSTNLGKMQPNKVPFLYNYSPHVVVPPLDYSDWIRITGYWFLDEAEWKPPAEFENLKAFIKKARDDGKKIVYVGFGSVVVEDSALLTKTIADAVVKADVRCILSKGWSDRFKDKDVTKVDAPLPPEVHHITYSVPHTWLFTQVDAATHHGGSGTTGASLRAGIPTIIKPFFGDQYFFGSRVEDLGVGICLQRINVSNFARALWEATHSERMIVKARILGEDIRGEDGVGTAIKAIYRDLEYAKSLIKRKDGDSKDRDDALEEAEETWTFVGDESDPDLQQAIVDWDPTRSMHGHSAVGGGNAAGKRRVA
ncbi:hypothetical protein EJ08DRAFT_653109 [Tothia fuscella]|uniref:sterol 3beta-glucosyltransferase n=1 Tax=Tothia fuscella TaxID=1048955 RepID=A0A9P4NI94_9PEZI|nr:hypothetical protein EJ08DRAFT_653109 [Tothia fuscella]